MDHSQSLSCACGKTNWSISANAPGRHLVCHCKDCQTFARFTGHSEIMGDHGGTHVYQTVPAGFSFTSNSDLRCLRLSPKGILRWYAGCCGTPIANTLARANFPMIGAIVPAPATAFGPVKGHVNVDSTRGAVKESGLESAVVTLFGRAIGAFFQMKTRSVFFTETGEPVVTPKVLTLAERNAASGGPGL